MKTSIIGDKRNLTEVIEILKSTGAFQMTEYPKTAAQDENPAPEKFDRLMTLKHRLEHVCELAKIRETKNSVTFDELKVFANYEKPAMEIVKSVEHSSNEIHAIDAIITRNSANLREIYAYKGMPIPFNMLDETKSTVNFCGIMPREKYKQFVRDFKFGEDCLSAFASGKQNMAVVLVAHHDDAPIAEAIYTYDFSPCPFRYDHTALEMLEILHNENQELHAKIAELRRKIKLNIEEERIIKNFYDYISNEIDTTTRTLDTLQTQKYFVINGWVVADYQPRVEKLLKKFRDIDVNFEKPTLEDNAPVCLKSSGLVTPFKNITGMYGVPGTRDIDPNPWVALFYFVFFGMMIGDIGYALVLCAGVAAFIYYKKPVESVKQFMLLFGICGISAIIWGFLFGSFFGFTVATQVIDPINGAIWVLLLSLMLGLLQMAVGLWLNLFNMIKQGHITKAILMGVPRVILFSGLLLFVPRFGCTLFNLSVPAFFDFIYPAGLYLTIAGAITTAVSNPYSLISYFNDTISYVRLFALALVGTVIASIGNTMGAMMFGIPVLGYVLGFLIAAAFHTFNLGLGLLSAYIHGARLQFIEFFSKFYNGDGVEFSPVGGNLRYTYIKGVK
jgi:V/A-type H+-transporting ATPase subunit I